MTLDEIFEKYTGDERFKRPNFGFSYPISWLKQFKLYGSEEYRDLGFIIPDFMIEDANADDWEIIK